MKTLAESTLRLLRALGEGKVRITVQHVFGVTTCLKNGANTPDAERFFNDLFEIVRHGDSIPVQGDDGRPHWVKVSDRPVARLRYCHVRQIGSDEVTGILEEVTLDEEGQAFVKGMLNGTKSE